MKFFCLTAKLHIRKSPWVLVVLLYLWFLESPIGELEAELLAAELLLQARRHKDSPH